MANRGYLSGPHRLLPGYTSIVASRNGVGAGSNSRASPPEFSYDAFPRTASGGSMAREGTTYTRTPPSPAGSALGIAYPNVNEFPYGLSGVQMPTYNFGSELYNYVSNGFPRKSRMCTFCNKVFTRSTTRRYHERRCPLLRASNSLAKSEENSTAAVAALKEQQQRLKETANAVSNQAPSTARAVSANVSNTSSTQVRSNLSSAPNTSSPPPPNLHPAYPSHFTPTSVLGSSPSRSAAAVYSYAHTYGSHFYNSISAAALASLDQNSNSLQSKKESDSKSWVSSPSPSSKMRDNCSTSNSLTANATSLSKSFSSTCGIDLTSRHSAEFSIRSQLPVFPTSALPEVNHCPSSPEPGETRSVSPAVNERKDMVSPQGYVTGHREWESPDPDKADYQNKISIANISGARLKASSPVAMIWNKKTKMEQAEEQYIKTQPVDDDDDEEEEDYEEEDEEEVEEDEEQFNENANNYNERDVEDKKGDMDKLSSRQNNPLMCQFCKKTFTDTVTRQAHEALHSQTKSFGCSLCSHAFHCAYSLRIHILRHHNQSPFRCKKCFAIFSETSELKSHLLAEHTLTKQEACSLRYFSLLDNAEHSSGLAQSGLSDSEHDVKEKNNPVQRRSADNLPNVLKDANQTVKDNEASVTEEQMINGSHGGEESEVCKICNKTFTKSFIRFHERAHADQKPYECPICNKRFGYKNNMKSHMKLHQGLKPYQCQICGARFTRGSTLRRHGRRHNISRNSMLDYVLYDHNAGPSRALGVSNSAVSAANAVAAATATNPVVTASTTNAASITVGSRYNRIMSGDHQSSKPLNFTSQGRPTYTPVTSSLETERFSSAGRRTPPRTSPASTGSPRITSSLLTSHTMTSPLVGGLSAVAAAANLFAYPAAAAPHLYQFYTSSSQLMPYSNYASSQNSSQAVQSDALNLSLGKRGSSFDDDEKTHKTHRKESAAYDTDSPIKASFGRNGEGIKIETEEPGEMIKGSNPFAQNFSSKKERHVDIHVQSQLHSAYGSRDVLKISTEDFAAQVNMCCPSPLVQSSTSSLQHQSSAGSPVGSSSCNDSNIQAHASPSGISHHSSPANSAPSPSNISEHHLQEVLLSLLTSGKMFRCSFCDIYFTEYAMFRLHQKYHQCDPSRPFLCSVCGEDCKDKTYFTVHLSEHLGLSSKSGLA